MHQFFFILMLLSLLAVVAVLVTGIIGMARGGEFNKKYGNKLMRARVMLQGLTLLFFALTYLSR
ncbi:MAG: twin transmembrane helix small protein [Alphaproteobacteria bacterium]|nr:twin transmembrane helix small protein [Alphaproteobacteria bacterium]MCB9974913.1 twin transmembrane helix small protein [Rhodospirillales bacterium]